MSRAGLRDVSTDELRALASELARGTFTAGVTRARLAAVHLGHLWEPLRGFMSLQADALGVLVDAVLAERDAARGDDVRLVWTGPEGRAGWAQPTAAAVTELFRLAERDVLLAGYTFDHGADVLEDLHAAMRDRGVVSEIFLHVPPPDRDADAADHLRSQVADFFGKNWPFGAPHPQIFIAPHTLDARARANLHAKCVVVDGRHALVGSANFTQRRQERNIEVGARITSQRFARQLVAQFHAAASEGVFVGVGTIRDGAHRTDTESA